MGLLTNSEKQNISKFIPHFKRFHFIRLKAAEKQQYLGARNAHGNFPNSVLFKTTEMGAAAAGKPPNFGGAHGRNRNDWATYRYLIKNPIQNRAGRNPRGAVIADEKAHALYGVPIVAGRPVNMELLIQR